jgi:hypothetical protein
MEAAEQSNASGAGARSNTRKSIGEGLRARYILAVFAVVADGLVREVPHCDAGPLAE